MIPAKYRRPDMPGGTYVRTGGKGGNRRLLRRHHRDRRSGGPPADPVRTRGRTRTRSSSSPPITATCSGRMACAGNANRTRNPRACPASCAGRAHSAGPHGRHTVQSCRHARDTARPRRTAGAEHAQADLSRVALRSNHGGSRRRAAAARKSSCRSP